MQVIQRTKAARTGKPEAEALLEELDEALVQAFPGPEPLSVLLIGRAGLLLQGITSLPVETVKVVIIDLMGSQERTLVFRSPLAGRVRRVIKDVGRHHGLKGEQQLFLNDDGASFVLDLFEQKLPPMRLLTAYRKLQLYVPCDLGYLLACLLMVGWSERDGADMTLLCQGLGIQSRDQAQHLVDQYFPSALQQAFYQLPRTLGGLFGQ